MKKKKDYDGEREREETHFNLGNRQKKRDQQPLMMKKEKKWMKSSHGVGWRDKDDMRDWNHHRKLILPDCCAHSLSYPSPSSTHSHSLVHDDGKRRWVGDMERGGGGRDGKREIKKKKKKKKKRCITGGRLLKMTLDMEEGDETNQPTPGTSK